MEYLRISGAENTSGGASTWPRGSRARPPPGRAPCLVGPWWLASTYSSHHTLLPPKKSPTSSSTSSSSFCCDFRSPSSKLHSQNCFGDCSSVCDSSNGPISFYSSALFIANFCCLGDPVLELACQIYMVKSSFNA